MRIKGALEAILLSERLRSDGFFLVLVVVLRLKPVLSRATPSQYGKSQTPVAAYLVTLDLLNEKSILNEKSPDN